MAELDALNPPNRALPSQRTPPSPSGSMREMLRDPLNFYLTLTRQYGDIVCYRPAPDPAYLINHPDFVRHVLVDNNRNYSKATSSNKMLARAIGNGLLTSEGDAWRKQRRMAQPAFHHTRLEKLDELIVSAATSMLERWQEHYDQGKPVDIAREMAALTLTITTRALFGVDLGDEVREVGEIINRAAAFLEKPSDPRLIQATADLATITDQIIQQRRQDFKDAGDLLSSLIEARDARTGEYMKDRELREQVLTLLLAGYETTASALTWTWYLLSQHPRAADRVLNEVRGTLGTRPPRYRDIESLPFTRMVLNEGLRMYPPAWILGRRALGRDRIGGYDVPADTVVAICIYTVHRHTEFWESPDVFDPERFLPERSARRHKFAYIPFGAGPRQCIGNSFGLMEATLAIACVAQRFQLRLLPGVQVAPQALFVLRPNRDMLMSLHP
jgi:cytochrome P450